MKRFCGLVLLVLFSINMLTGCASVFGGKNLSVKSDPSKANVVIRDSEDNIVADGITGTPIRLKKIRDYTIELNKEGYIPVKAPLKKKFNGWFWSNIIFSAIGFGYSFGLDRVLFPEYPKEGHDYHPLTGYDRSDTDSYNTTRNTFYYMGLGVGTLGAISAIVDIATGNLYRYTPPPTFTLVKTPETLAAEEEERNKYIILPKVFNPADYASADLFSAVAAAEKFAISDSIILAGDYYTYAPSKRFVSDVVFVSQNGTDIRFRTADNAIAQTMKVSVRTGLTAGQQVLVYYYAYRIKDWSVVAIKRL
jgi:hypothetical protein